MAVIQCKICGGEVDITPGLTMGECPYCHTVTTFPRFKFQGIETLYRRAEEARRSGNYDKAISVYEEIINSDNGDPEAYWGLVLSTWGIEYVEDPLTKERKPTCHRVQFESILDDANFKKALEISSGGEAEIYKQEALKIAEIQKNILKISAQEKPFDIFICYKESDESGQRTPDSVFAQELYGTLSAKGYKVFFARVTLEDKVGLYEPYIFSALNSAKVMLVIGSKKEYFEAVWVRNEWSRFLFLMRKQPGKVLIPCYRNMNAYDIPKELSMFQAQDMNKIGFVQDLMHGLTKILGNGAARQTSTTSATVPEFENLLKRAYVSLQNDNFYEATNFAEKTLNKNPKCGEAYLVKLLAKFRAHKLSELSQVENFSTEDDFKNAMTFGDENLRNALQSCISIHSLENEKKKRKDRSKTVGCRNLVIGMVILILFILFAIAKVTSN